ncbi:MerR family DNA-binding transcriptional regulator [Brachybacterium sp.]|uniref:MerR family DNA-binding transcriptional regulator n=1 Tax=Brachybacterium sp. TaxID=1891286 RepID=UPI002ECFD914
MHDSDAADQRLLTISTFARAVGIPPSALRHYSANDLLVPADVDPRSGYRYYAPEQIAQGVLVQRMRAAAVPLPAMRSVLAAVGPERTAVLDALLAEHSSRSTELETGLRSLRDELSGAPSARVPLPGPALADALRQVLPAATTAAEDLAVVVWVLGPDGLALVATDRYWLAHRLLPSPTDSAPTRLVSTVDAARSLASRCAAAGTLEVEIADDAVTVRRSDGSLLLEVPSAGTPVPDLDRLIASQPPARAMIGVDRCALLDLTASRHRWSGGGEVGLRLRLEIDGAVARLRRLEEPSCTLTGWVARETGDAPAEILLQAALLEAAVERCPAEEVVLAVVDETTPLRVLSPSQDTFTCLVMPMRP